MPNTAKKFRICQASSADLDVLCRLVVETMDADPLWQYRFPYRKEHPEEHLRCTKENWARFFAPTELGHWVVEVVHQANSDDCQPVAFAVWLVPDTNKFKPPSGSSSTARPGRLDVDHRRLNIFNRAVTDTKKQHLDPRFGTRQMHLQYLGTHPRVRRLGIASMLLRRGIKEAEVRGFAVTLYASEIGQSLYGKFGFRELETKEVQVPGEAQSDRVAFTVMARFPSAPVFRAESL